MGWPDRNPSMGDGEKLIGIRVWSSNRDVNNMRDMMARALEKQLQRF